MTLDDIITFPLLERFTSKLKNGVKAGGNVWIGVGEKASDVTISSCLRNNYKLGTPISLTADELQIIAIYPSDMTKAKILMSGLICPTTLTTVTVDSVTYNMLTSINNYEGTFNITIE